MQRTLFTPLVLLIAIFSLLSGCQRDHEPSNQITVGTIAGPETQLMQTAKQVAEKRYGLHIKIVQFTDYALPNAALANGSLDANAFQDLPYLNAAIQARDYKLVSIGNTFLYPLGIYSKKIHSLSELKTGAKVAIDNDPNNEARALLLLQTAGLIKLKAGAGATATVQAIIANPKQLKITPLNAAQVPRALPDVDIAVINTNYAIPAGLFPKRDALFVENAKGAPYMNIIVVRTADKNNPKLQELVKAFQSEPLLEEANKLFKGQAIPGWQVKIK